jgi:tripartite-type tricarboxylate transporter receptor subunit TctC
MSKIRGKNGMISVLSLILVLLSFLSSPVLSAEFPTKSMELVITWTPGGPSDLAARLIAKFAEKNLGQAVAPINMVGGNCAVGWNYLNNAKRDGYTIGQITFDILTNQAMGSDIKFDTSDYLLQFTRQPLGLCVHKDSPYKTLQDLIIAAKAKPGEIKIATTGLGAWHHQAGYMLEKKYGVQFNFVPFKGSAEITAAELGRHVDADINTVTTFAQHAKAGTVRMLLCFSNERLPEYPDVPSIVELGISEAGIESWRAIAVPKGVPAPVRARLEAAFVKAYNDPEFQQLAKKSNFDLIYRNNDQLVKFLEKAYPVVRETLKGMGYAK